ncbi:hypothetical protein pb186bvf_008889 [Paramecium bursaria]
MEEKINKLFALFNDMKNQQLFGLALTQIVSIYNDYPECLFQILRQTNKLVYSHSPDPRLRLEHSQIGAAIIERTYKLFWQSFNRITQFKDNQDDIPANLFHFEPILNKPQEQMEIEKTNSYEIIHKNISLKQSQIDFVQLIKDEDMILGKDKKLTQRSIQYRNRKDQIKTDPQDIEQQIFESLGISANFNQQNAQVIYDYLQGNIDFIVNLQGDSDPQSEFSGSDDDALGQYQTQKKKQVKAQLPKVSEYCVINPFNIIFNRALYEILSERWQERHSSGLVLRSITRQAGFEYIGFQHLIKQNEDTNIALRHNLENYINNKDHQLAKVKQVLTRCCVLIAMDRFADYISDQTHMVVREVGCQIAITLISSPIYKQLIWNQYPKEIEEFILLMKQFVQVSQQCQIYEVSQSALFLINGLLNDHQEFIFQEFSELLLQVGINDQVEEVQILLADIWRQFVNIPNEYYIKVYHTVIKQIEQQDDICYSSKAIFQLLEHLFLSNFHLDIDFEKELDIYKKFYFHKTTVVRQAFFSFFHTYLKYNKNCKVEDQEQIQTIMQVTFQSSFYEDNKIIFDHLSLIFYQLTVFLSQNQMNQILNKCVSISQSQNYRQSFVVFKNMKKDINTIFPIQTQMTPLDSTFYRMIKCSHLLKYIDIQINDQELTSSLYIWYLKDYLNGNLNNKQCQEITQISGDLYHQIDLEIQIQLLDLNLQLTQYSKIEKQADYLQTINQFLKIYNDYVLAPAHSNQLRQMYPSIMQQLMNLGQIDYDMDSNSATRLQGSMQNLVAAIQQFNRYNNEMLLNFRVLLTDSIEILVNRLKVDKFHIISDMAAIKLSDKLYQDHDSCDLAILYNKIPVNQLQIHYILEPKGPLKRRDYGRKKLMYMLLDNEKYNRWFLFYERMFLSQISLFIKDPKIVQSQQVEQTIQVKYEEVRLNIWGLRMIQNVYSCLEKDYLDTWALFILDKLSNLVQLLSNIQLFNPKEYYFQNTKGNTFLYVFDVEITKFQTFIPSINKLFSKLLVRIIKTKNIQIIDQVFILINQLFKTDTYYLYEILQNLIRDYPTISSQYSGFLSLKTIKKLTNNNTLISQSASKLLGSLVPILTIQESIYAPQHPFLQMKFKKALEFQQGFGKMTQVDYQLQGGMLDKSILRDYQWDGIRWLGFLVKYNLHGALCDDMGLGKTIQTLAVIANEVYKKKDQKLLSLVIAPSTVIDHWYAETQKYIDPKILKPCYQEKVDGNLLMISYNQMLKAPPNILDQEYFFLILDEAHILKNSKNKSSKIIRSLKAKHKIVLSGTPVQNHLLELWSLFDLLLQNYLGDEEYFKKNFSKAFHTNLFSLTDSEMIFDEQQTKTLKLLHQKVLPFIMRRTKQDVLPQLPAKIIEDYYCKLAVPLQQDLYEILEKNSFSNDLQQKLEKTKGDQKTKICESIFKLLQLLRQVLDHPYLIKHNFTQVKKATNKKKKVKTNTHDIETIINNEIDEIFQQVPDPESYQHSGKMIALKDILQQLGFNSIDETQVNSNEQIQTYTNYNKVLIFSRFRKAIQMIAEQLLTSQFPSIKYLILDGQVTQNQRYPLVTKFNEDPDIRVLLLTTQVGGLGLNLSSANIVIMFDHDYNPVNDQQAMDRAHRIGQKNVVQVFRMIVKDTLEEKIMGIQRFKNAISKAIVNSDNAALATMEKTDILSMIEQSVNEPGIYLQIFLTKDAKNNNQNDKTEKLIGPYSKILGHLKLDLLEELNFDNEY